MSIDRPILTVQELIYALKTMPPQASIVFEPDAGAGAVIRHVVLQLDGMVLIEPA